MHTASFSNHGGDLIVAGIVLQLAAFGAKNGLFRSVVLGMQAMTSLILAMSFADCITPWLPRVGIPATTALGVSFLASLAVAAVGLQHALHTLIDGRNVRLPPMIDRIGGGLAGGLAGVAFAGSLLIALSMLPMPAALRLNANSMALDAGSKMLATVSRCLDIAPKARRRLMDSYRLAAWNRAFGADEPPPPPLDPLVEEQPGEEMDRPVSPQRKPNANSLSDLDLWTIEAGTWEITEDGHVRGKGDSRLRLKSPIPWGRDVSLRMRVHDGFRPAVLLTAPEVDVWLGNNAFGRSLTLHGRIEKQRESPSRYSFDEVYAIRFTLSGDRVRLVINSKEIATATVMHPPAEWWLTLSAGNALSPGNVEFWDFSIRPSSQR